MPSNGDANRSPDGVHGRWWQGWPARFVLFAVIVLGGLVWWQVGPGARVHSPEARRREARIFLKLAVAEARGVREPNRAQLLSEIAPAQDAAGDAAGAEETVASIEDVTRQTEEAVWQGKAWIAIATARFKAGNVEGGRRSFAAAIRSAKPLEVEPDRLGEALGSIAVAQAEAGEIEAAAQTTVTIGRARDRVTAWAAIATAQAKSGDAAGCRQSLALASEAAEAASDMDIWMILAAAQTKAGDAAGQDRSYIRAVAQAHTSANLNGYARLLAMIALRQSQVGDKEGAGRTLVFDAEAERAIPGAGNRSSILEILAACRAFNGDPPGATRAMDTLITKSHRWRLSRCLALVQNENGDLPTALATVRTLAEADDQADILGGLAVQLARRGDPGGSQRVFALATEAAQANLNGHKLDSALERIASDQAEVGDTAAALRTMAVSGEQPDQQSTWSDIAVALAKAGDAGGAEKIVCRYLRPETYPWWMRAWDRFLLAIGRTPRSYNPFKAIFPAWEANLEEYRAKAVSAAARARARTGDTNTAVAAILDLPKGEARCKGYQEIAAGLLEAPAGRDGR